MINKYLYYLLTALELALWIFAFFFITLVGIPWITNYILTLPIGY